MPFFEVVDRPQIHLGGYRQDRSRGAVPSSGDQGYPEQGRKTPDHRRCVRHRFREARVSPNGREFRTRTTRLNLGDERHRIRPQRKRSSERGPRLQVGVHASDEPGHWFGPCRRSAARCTWTGSKRSPPSRIDDSALTVIHGQDYIDAVRAVVSGTASLSGQLPSGLFGPRQR